MGRIPESWKHLYHFGLRNDPLNVAKMDFSTPREFHHSRINFLKVKCEIFRRWKLHLSQSRKAVRAYTDDELLKFRNDLLDQIPDPYPPGYLD